MSNEKLGRLLHEVLMEISDVLYSKGYTVDILDIVEIDVEELKKYLSQEDIDYIDCEILRKIKWMIPKVLLVIY